MKKTILTLATLCLMTGITITACKKKTSDPEPETASTTGTTTTGGTTTGGSGTFTWTPAGASPIVADSAFCNAAYNTVIAFKGGYSNYFEINLSGLSVAAYSVTGTSSNAITYMNSTSTYTTTSGNVNITNNASTNVSGNFSASMVSGSLSASFTGTFANVIKR